MNITLLRHAGIGEPSCSKLVRRLAELRVNVKKVDDYNESLDDTDVLIRWGHVGRFTKKDGAIVLNRAKSIELGANKRDSRKLLQENGVSVPKSYFSTQECLNAKFPLIGRPAYHTQGRDVEFLNGKEDLKNSNSAYYSEFIKKDREFRVYVFGGKAIGMVEKTVEDKSQIAWNSHKGATFTDIFDLENYQDVVNEAVKAAKVIGQYFSGVDIMTKNGKPYILELNSSLALSNPHRVDIFARAFKNVFDNYKKFGKLV